MYKFFICGESKIIDRWQQQAIIHVYMFIHVYMWGWQCRRHCTERHPYWIKNIGFPLNFSQLRTYDYLNFTLSTPSGQKFLMKILVFSALRSLFCSRIGSNCRKLLKMIKIDPSKPKLMTLRKFCTFSENFLKNFPILR